MYTHELEHATLELSGLKLQNLKEWNNQLLNRGECPHTHSEDEKTFKVVSCAYAQENEKAEYDISDKKSCWIEL